MHSVKSSDAFAHSRLIITKILDLREKLTGRQMFVSVFYRTSIRNTEHLAIYALDERQNAFRSSYRVSVSTVLVKRPDIKFLEKSFRDFEFVICFAASTTENV
jgi:hypothetical protein